MKNYNLIEWLWKTDSHEKQSPQRFARYAVMLLTLLTLGVGQMWADTGFYNCYFTYNDGSNHSQNQDASGMANKDLGTLSSDLTIKAAYLKVWDNNGSSSRKLNNGQFVYTKDNWSNKSYAGEGSWTLSTKDGNNYELQKSSVTWTLASLTEASGSYTLKYYWQAWGDGDKYLNNGGSNYQFTYKIAPPAISSFSVNRSGYISGAGTSGNPYIVEYNSGTLTLTVNGSKEHTDANSTLKYWKDSGAKQNSSTLTVTGITSSDLQSVVVHAQCINNSDGTLVGTESNTTIYYKAGYTITPVAKYTTDGSTYTTGTTGGTVTINSSSSAIGVVKDATYSIVATPASGYCVEEIKVGETVAWEQANDNNRQTAAKTISTYTATADKTVTVKFARIQNITLHIHDGGVGGLVIQNATPKVGAHTVSLPNTTLTSEGNGWYYHTFDNVTSVTVLNVACSNTGAAAVANAGQPISTYTLSQTEYFSAIHSQNDGSSSICNVLGVSYTNQSYSIGSPAITLNPTYTLAPSGSPTYSWSVTSQPVGGAYSLSATDVASPTFSSTVEGTYTLRVQVTTGGCTKSTSFDVEVANGVPDPEISGATFVTNPILSNAHLQISVTYANIPAEGCYIRLKQGAGYWNDENNSAWTALSSGSGSMTFTTNNTNVPTGTWTIELYNNAKNSLLSSTNVTGSLSVLTAQTITISAGANGSVSPTIVYAGSGYRSESFTATPNDHYHFVNWSNNNSSNVTVNDVNSATTYVSTAAAAATITANFAGDQYSITYKDQGDVAFSGSHVDSPSSHPTTHTYGTATTLNSATKTGYSFGGWFTTSNCASGTDVTSLGTTAYTSNITLYAKWTENMTTVTINANPAGAGTFTVDASAFTEGNTTTAGVATSHTVVATPTSGKVFHNWTVTGNATGSASTNTYTLEGNGNAGTGTLTANFGIASGWYMYGNAPWGNTWNKSEATAQLTYPYRGMSGVYYIPTTIAASKYFRITDKSKEYNFSSNTGSDLALAKGTIYTLAENSSKATYSTSNLGSVWVVMNTNGTKKAWVQDPQTFYNVNVTNEGSGSKGTYKVTLNSTSAFTKGSNVFETTQYANGETFKVTVTGVSGWIPTITIGGVATTFWKQASTYEATGTMSTADIDVTISYTASRAVRFATTTGCDELTATGPSSTAVSDNTMIKDGTEITFHQANATGYTFSKWYSNNTGTSGTEYSDEEDDYALTISSSAYTIYPLYTENMTTVNLIASPTGKGTFTSGGTVTSVSAGIDTHPTVTAVPGTGYHLTGTIWSESSSYISLSATNTASTTITATGTKGNSANLTATFTPNTYTVRFHRNGGAGDVVNQDFTYDAAQNLTANTYTRTGYTFAGWALTTDGSVTYANSANVSNLTATDEGTFHLYAKWTPKQSALTLDKQTSAEGYGSAGTATASASAAYDAAMPALTGTLPTAAQGYAFMGFYDETGGGGTKYYNADGSSAATWDKDTESGTTLYAYYKKAEITALTLEEAIVGTAETDSITVTPTISPIPTGTTRICWEIQYSNGTALPTQPEGRIVSGNTYRFKAPTSSATYKIQCTLYTGSICGSGTLLDTRVTTFQVAGEHTVTIRYQDADGRTLAASTSITARPLDWTTLGDITPPSLTGYTFARWDAGDGVSIKNGASETTSTTTSSIQIKAVYDGTLTAVYNKRNLIYFNNTLGWEHVYVYFYSSDKYWTSGSGSNTGTGASQSWEYDSKKPYYRGFHGEMTRIEGTNIYYWDFMAGAREIDPSYGYEIDNADNVAFTKDNQHTYSYFYNTEAVRRGDFNHSLSMFVPLADQTPDMHNGTKYYSSGYWMNYPENTGYDLLIYNQKTKDGATKLYEIPFEYTEDYTMPMELVVDLEAGQTYGFEIKRADGEYYGNTGTMKANTTNWSMEKDKDSYCGLQTTAAGDYKFRLYYSDSKYRMDVTYPVAVNDYRIVYTDLATWSKGAHTASWNHPSGVITKNSSATEVKKDTVSFFWAYGSSPAIKYQQCTATGTGSVTWNAGTAISVSSFTSVLTKPGVYNFIFEQPAGGASISLVGVEPYTGNYYIRTDCAGSTKWANFQSLDHQMTYSDYAAAKSAAADNTGFTHYYAHWATTGQNVKFVIANDYSQCITDTLIEDIGTVVANITAEGNSNAGRLNSGNASIRFMWNIITNKLSRAYIAGSSVITDRFLVLEGDAKMFDENGNALTGLNRDHNKEGNVFLDQDNQVVLHDDENFVYEREIKVQTGAQAKLTAKYNNNVQYFIGGSSETIELLGGEESETKNRMRIVYDFKTNRLVTAYMPDGEITEDMAIHADVMLVREHQNAGQQLIFNGGSLSEVKTVYGVMRFNRWTLNNKSTAEGHAVLGDPKSPYERGLYWISFPFDVNLGDVFGFGTYGTHWIIMEYDGAERASKGYWKDSDGFWKYVTSRTGKVLEAGKGYVLALDLDLMRDNDATFWSNNIEQVELFFPSTDAVENIEATDVTTSVDEHECTIDRTGNNGSDINKNRTKADSHWNIIGIPSYANYGTTLKDGEGNDITWNSSPYTNDLPFLYEWNMVDNTYTVQSGTTYPFKSMHAYMVQYNGDLKWTLASATPTSPIVARRTYAEEPQNVEFRLELQQNDKMIDQTFVKLSNDEKTSGNFIFDEDLCKEYNGTKANIYTFIEGYIPAAGNTLPMSEQTTVIPVGVQIKTDGEYTFAMPAGTDGVGVTLIDNVTNTRTNLGLTDYTVILSSGTIDGRFVLEISPIAETPTDIEAVSDQNSAVRKVMIDGILYIVKGNRIYDATGALVK